MTPGMSRDRVLGNGISGKDSGGALEKPSLRDESWVSEWKQLFQSCSMKRSREMEQGQEGNWIMG